MAQELVLLTEWRERLKRQSESGLTDVTSLVANADVQRGEQCPSTSSGDRGLLGGRVAQTGRCRATPSRRPCSRLSVSARSLAGPLGVDASQVGAGAASRSVKTISLMMDYDTPGTVITFHEPLRLVLDSRHPSLDAPRRKVGGSINAGSLHATSQPRRQDRVDGCGQGRYLRCVWAGQSGWLLSPIVPNRGSKRFQTGKLAEPGGNEPEARKRDSISA
jgi:hypothetical protein